MRTGLAKSQPGGAPGTAPPNPEAQNYDFATKKVKYFAGPNGVATFALTSQVNGVVAWTPQVLEERQRTLLGLLAGERQLKHG